MGRHRPRLDLDQRRWPGVDAYLRHRLAAAGRRPDHGAEAHRQRLHRRRSERAEREPGGGDPGDLPVRQRNQLASARRGPAPSRRRPGPGARPQAGSGRREADPDRGRHRDANGRGNRQVQAHGDGPDRRCLAQRRRRPELDTGLGAGRARRNSRVLRRGRHRSRIPAGQARGGRRRPGRRRVPVRQRDELDAGGGSDDSRRFHPRSDERRPRRRRARRPVRPDADHLPLAGRRRVAAAAGGARSLSLSAIPGAAEPQLAVNAVAAQGGTQVAVGSANGFPAAWISADGGRTLQRGTGQSPAVLDRPGIQQLTSVTHGSAGWLAVGGVTAGAPQHPVILAAADGTTWSAVDAQPAFAGGGLYPRQAAPDRGVYVIVGYQQVPETTITASRRTVRSTRTIATAWWSAGLTGWNRAGLAAAGALDGDGISQMLAVTATADGFVGVGAHDARPAAWMTRDGSTWTQAGLPLPAGAASAVLEHIAANGRTVGAIGMAQTAAGQVPFAVQSADGGASWKETDLPMPAGTTRITAGSIQVTALAAADGGFAGTGTFGT